MISTDEHFCFATMGQIKKYLILLIATMERRAALNLNDLAIGKIGCEHLETFIGLKVEFFVAQNASEFRGAVSWPLPAEEPL